MVEYDVFCWLQMEEGEKGRRKEADVFWKHLLETIFSRKTEYLKQTSQPFCNRSLERCFWRKRESLNLFKLSVTDPWKEVSREKENHSTISTIL